MPILPHQLTPAPDSPAAVSRWSVPFQTLEEARAYLSGDSITCLVCGAVMHKLPKHLKDIHGMTSDDYRRRFGIPFGRSLTSATARENMRRSLSPEKIAKFRAAAEVQRANRASRKGLPRTTRGVISSVPESLEGYLGEAPQKSGGNARRAGAAGSIRADIPCAAATRSYSDIPLHRQGIRSQPPVPNHAGSRRLSLRTSHYVPHLRPALPALEPPCPARA